jgi:hypothetical protein
MMGKAMHVIVSSLVDRSEDLTEEGMKNVFGISVDEAWKKLRGALPQKKEGHTRRIFFKILIFDDPPDGEDV